jgi:hypothetical protein
VPGEKAPVPVPPVDLADFGAAPGHPEPIRFDDARRASQVSRPSPTPFPAVDLDRQTKRESRQEFICRRSAPTAALSIEGPTKNEFRRTIIFSSHPSEPMVDERGLPNTTPGNDCNDVNILVCPCTIQESEILLSAKNIASFNGQFGYGNLLRCKSSQRLASSDTRSGRKRLL